MRKTFLAIATAAAVATIATANASAADDVRISIGSYNLNNLPYPLALGLGYFKDEGLNVTSQNFAKGGSSTLGALIAGSTDIAVGFYDHTIGMQAKGKHIEAVVLQADNSGIVLAGRKDTKFDPAKPETIKGMKIGITSPGSSSDFFVRYYLNKHGISPDDVSIIGVGSGSAAVAALQHGNIDLLANYDPAATILVDRGIGKVLIDARTKKGAEAVYGGIYPTSTLYATRDYVKNHPKIVQKVVNAEVKALKYIQAHSAKDIVDHLPTSFVSGSRDIYIKAVANVKSIMSPDGKFDPATLKTPLGVLSAFNPAVKVDKIHLDETYTNAFVEKASKVN